MFVRNSIAIASLLVLSSAATTNAQIFRRGNSYQAPPVQRYNPPAQSQQSFAPSQPQVANDGQIKLHWSQEVLKDVTRDHDFGAVARASTQRHVFEYTNTLDSDLMLTGARVSCGCTKVQILTQQVKPGEKGQIEAVLDTRNFTGQRGATVTVSAQKTTPYNEYSELRFSVKGMIRTDVVFAPGSVEFGEVMSGNTTSRSVVIKYAGDPNWKVESVTSSNDHFKPELVEVERDMNTRRVTYQLNVAMDDSLPEGTWNEQLTIQTNDRTNASMSLPLNALIAQPIAVADINLGLLRKGEKYDKKLIVKGKQPFEIIQVSSSNPKLRFESSNGSKTLHIIQYQFDAEAEGLVKDQINITTTDPSQPEIKIGFDAQVVSETIATGREE
ncbi:MAG: DUF1573 domain-containing protein [Pirellulaceae bacterium]